MAERSSVTVWSSWDDRVSDAVGHTVVSLQVEHGLEPHPGAEQLLDDHVVQVAGEAFAVLEEPKPALLGSSLIELQRGRRFGGEASNDFHVVGTEGGGILGANEEHHVDGARRLDGDHDHGSDGVEGPLAPSRLRPVRPRRYTRGPGGPAGHR